MNGHGNESSVAHATVTPNLPEAGSLVNLADLKRKSVRGGMVTFVSQGASIVIQLASTVILARLLTPQDYGIMAMVVAVTAFAGLFRDLGLSAAAIQKHNLTQSQQSNLFWLNVALGVALTMGLAAASPLVAWFYHKPEVLWVTIVLSATFLISSLAAQSNALLVRNMWFGRQTGAKIASALINLVVSVTLALQGFRYWALVWGQLAGTATSTLLLFLLSPFRPSVLRRGVGVKEMVKFGAHVTAFDFVNYFQRNLDKILIGRFTGSTALGLYSRAYALLMFPITNLRGPINAVAFPALSRLQNQPEAFRAYYLRVTSLLALLSMPLTAFLFVASKPVIELSLGNKWLGAGPIFSWLALAAFVQPASGLAGSLLLSLGKGRRYFQCGLFNAIILSACFIIGLPWGANGVAMAYAVGNYIVLYPWLRWAFQGSPVSFRDFANACIFPAMVSLIAAALVLLVESQLAAFSAIAQTGIVLLIFSVVFAGATCLTTSGRKHILFITQLVRQFGAVPSQEK